MSIIIIFQSYKSKIFSSESDSFEDFGLISIMYHRFDESKYPSTNIQLDIFKKQLEIIKNQESSLINMLKVSNGILIRTPYSKSIRPNEKKKILVFDEINNQKLLTC